MTPAGNGRRGPRRAARSSPRTRSPGEAEPFEEQVLDDAELDNGDEEGEGPLTQVAIELAKALRRMLSGRVPPKAVGHLFKAQREILLAGAAVIEHNRRLPDRPRRTATGGTRSSRSSPSSGSKRSTGRRSSRTSRSAETGSGTSGRRPTRVELD